ncbi:MAG TPA: TadE/TadG family type IV pilus assembly protein [Candidatus Cybelea sp.]|nr:TadE/TadG family type IV pilus assembly protein [Candidatus Cybelea sp.]
MMPRNVLTRLRTLLRPERSRRFGSDGRGVAAVEFALILPILVLLLIGCFEVPRFVTIYQRIARTSAGVADLVAQADEPMTKDNMTDIFSAGLIMMQPYDAKKDGVIIVSSVNNPAGKGVKVTWQERCGKLAATSVVGNAGSTPLGSFPVAINPGSDEEVIAAEVFFTYKPVFSNIIYKGSTLSLVSYTRPRNQNLMTDPGAPDCTTQQ